MSQVKPPEPNPSLTAGRRPTGLPITAGCDTARDRTQVCSDASSTVLQTAAPLGRPESTFKRGERTALHPLPHALTQVLGTGIGILYTSY